MANLFKLRKGLDINLQGKAEKKKLKLKSNGKYALLPDCFEGVVPKVVVKEGDKVKAGDALFINKNCQEMKFASPVSGTVTAVERGERRKVLAVKVQADATQVFTDFGVKDVASLTGEQVKEALLEAGLFGYINQLPYDVVTTPDTTPKAIFVSALRDKPLAADFEFELQGQEKEWQAGLTALSKMAKTCLGIGARQTSAALTSAKDVEVNVFDGPCPAGNVGVQINHVLPIAKRETVWTINVQDLAVIGRLFTKGIVDMQKLVALTGPLAATPQYYRVLPGMPVSAVFGCNVQSGEPVRYVAGNPLSGHQVGLDEMISVYDNQFTALDEGSETHEFMGWLIPRFGDFNASCTDPAKPLQRLFGQKEYNWDARLKGGRRAIIVSGEYDKVFPMDIYPEYLIKAMIAGNLDRMEQLGAYEVAPEDFALCEYVCTSKMPLQAIVRAALDNLKNEVE